jgi:hypothetical protein
MVHAIALGELLPGTEVVFPPAGTALCRRVRGHDLWLFYRVEEEIVYVLYVSRVPPLRGG